MFLYIFLGIFFISFLYAFEFFKGTSNNYKTAKNNALSLQKENRKSLAKVHENIIPDKVYAHYLEVNKEYKQSVKEFELTKKTEKVFQFKNMKAFIYELFPTLALFIYFVFNLYRSFKNENKNLGIKLIHGVFIMYAFFKLFWIFQQFQDFAKPVYYLMTLISAYLVGLAIYCIHKQEVSAFKKLRKKLLTVSYFAVKNTEGKKKEEMIEVIKNVAKS